MGLENFIYESTEEIVNGKYEEAVIMNDFKYIIINVN